jgi:hypothetical protein
MSVYRSATIRWRGLEGLCLIRNISPAGMMGRVHTDIEPGEQLTVEIRSGRSIPGHVIWTADRMIGVQFAQRIEVMDVLQAPVSGEAGAIQRMPRVRLACPVSLLIDGVRQRVALVDISQGGAKLDVDFLKPQDELVLAIKGMEARRAVVRWARDGQAGVAFLVRIPFDELAEWVLERQTELAAEQAEAVSPPSP